MKEKIMWASIDAMDNDDTVQLIEKVRREEDFDYL